MHPTAELVAVRVLHRVEALGHSLYLFGGCGFVSPLCFIFILFYFAIPQAWKNQEK
jgi:hypothetical protein